MNHVRNTMNKFNIKETAKALDKSVSNGMKRLLKGFVLTIASLFALSSVAMATPSNGWKVNISSPANTTSKSFKVQYTTLSISSGDHIQVELFENGASKGSQTTTKAYGDSGDFDVTVPSAGTYSYFIKATNTGDPTSKNTSSVSVAVSNQPQTVTTTTNTGSTDSANGGGGGSSAATGAGGGGQTGTTTNPAGGAAGTGGTGADGEVNAAETGQVGDDPANTGADAVLGETTAKGNKPSNSTVALITAGLAALVLASYAAYRYVWLPRQQK